MPRFVLAAALFGAGLAVSAEDSLPSAFTRDRYESLRQRSPFAVATAVAPSAPQVSFASNWFISGVARIGDDNFVTVQSRDLSRQFTIFSGQEVDGVTLASVNWSDQVGKSTVVLRKGTETARLEFNEAQLHAVATAGPAVKPMANAAANPPPPVNRNVAVANQAGSSMPPPAAAAAAQKDQPLRRRALPIPVPPR